MVAYIIITNTIRVIIIIGGGIFKSIFLNRTKKKGIIESSNCKEII